MRQWSFVGRYVVALVAEYLRRVSNRLHSLCSVCPLLQTYVGKIPWYSGSNVNLARVSNTAVSQGRCCVTYSPLALPYSISSRLHSCAVPCSLAFSRENLIWWRPGDSFSLNFML